MLEGRSRPVYFTSDTSVFKDSLFPNPILRYADLFYLRGNAVNEVPLKKGETTYANIYEPTLFDINGFDKFLAYPGEKLYIKRKDDHYIITAKNNSQRNRELSVMNKFYEVEKYPSFPLLFHPSLDTVLYLERELRNKLEKAQAVSETLFDSLCTANQVSKKFKRLSSSPKNKYDAGLFLLYDYYKAVLVQNGLYSEKCRQLLPAFNRVSNMAQLNDIHVLLNHFAFEIGIKFRVGNSFEFRSSFDTIMVAFKALPRDYLLSKLTYYAYTHEIKVPAVYFKKYKKNVHQRDYRKIIFKAKANQKLFKRKTLDTAATPLIAAGQKNFTSVHEILAASKGKFVLMDFWASWCVPCLKEMPYWNQLVQKYGGEKIVFANISLDRDIQFWEKAIIARGFDKRLHYLLLNPEESAFIRQYNINTIPRYLLFDQNGKEIDTDAPWPSDPQLTIMIDNYLKNK